MWLLICCTLFAIGVELTSGQQSCSGCDLSGFAPCYQPKPGDCYTTSPGGEPYRFAAGSLCDSIGCVPQGTQCGYVCPAGWMPLPSSATQTCMADGFDQDAAMYGAQCFATNPSGQLARQCAPCYAFVWPQTANPMQPYPSCNQTGASICTWARSGPDTFDQMPDHSQHSTCVQTVEETISCGNSKSLWFTYGHTAFEDAGLLHLITLRPSLL